MAVHDIPAAREGLAKMADGFRSWADALARASAIADQHRRRFMDMQPILLDNRRPGDVHLTTGAILLEHTMSGPVEARNGTVFVTPNQALAARPYGWRIDDRFAGVATLRGVVLVAVAR